MHRPISPPSRKRPLEEDQQHAQTGRKRQKHSETEPESERTSIEKGEITIIRSPIRLYSIKDLPSSENVDAVGIRDLLSPVSAIDELWSFNFMTNMQFIRNAIGVADESRVKIRIVHGYWRQEDTSRKAMEAGVWAPNVKLISAYLRDPFGTHHSKIIVLFRTDDTAQVIVHTGNNLF